MIFFYENYAGKYSELAGKGGCLSGSEDERSWLHLVHDHHRCYIKLEGEPEREMNMSEDMIIKIMLYGELSTREEYQSCKLNGDAPENLT